MNNKILKWNLVFQYGYVLTNILNSVILVPLYLKHIDRDTLGIWWATGGVLGWMTLVDPGIGEVLQQQIAEMRGKNIKGEVGKAIGSGFIASGIILVVSILIGFIFYLLLGVIINKDVSHYPNLEVALGLTIFATGMSLVSFSMTGINQGLLNSANVAISALLANTIFLIINVLFLYLDYGLISIAFANVCRALFINIYNIFSMKTLLNKEKLRIEYDFPYFKKFIRIFSFTSASKIISGFSGSLDTVILARYIPPSMITVLENNRKPILQTQSLIGRHSVALMPLISHAKGTGDNTGIINLINKQFKFYSYAVMFICFVFCFNYNDLITAWLGNNQYAGNTIMYLLVCNLFFYLIGYFMSNMGYALGDLKINSMVNIARGLLSGLLVFLVAKKYGIVGTLSVSMIVLMITDAYYFSYRLYSLGYLQASLVKNTIKQWIVIFPLSLVIGLGFKIVLDRFFPSNLHLTKLIINATLFTISYLLLLFLKDLEIRETVKQITNNLNIKKLFRFTS